MSETVAGRWMMFVTINAENYKKEFTFLLTLKTTERVGCQPVQELLW
jgi:hypothetical protein